MYSLDQECFSPAFRFDRESMRAFAEEPDAIVRIALLASGKIIGFVIVHIEPVAGKQRAYVVTLDVAEQYRRHGLAQRLLSQAEEHAAAAGAQWMELHVFTGNDGAIRFYESSGYGRVSVSRRFYGRAGLDAFVYRKNL
ncbi:N-acetyltransferase [Tunturibacter empetritectus]|uniref:N-acetyltransferase n=2 Tax=Tunturiibacter empetritectus TaxID=3069691 RepID=A0AAU7ZJT4_9BACT